MKIVSHLKPRHLDDYLSIMLLKSKYPTADVEYVHPQRVPQEYYADKEVYLIDVGGEYNAELKNFDHHQDKNIQCSFCLVLLHEFDAQFLNLKTVQAIDVIDRFGYMFAVNQGLTVPNKDVENLRKILLLVEPSKQAGDIACDVLKRIAEGKEQDDLNMFITLLYREFDAFGLLEEAKKVFEAEEKLFKEKLSRAEIKNLGNLTIAISYETLSPRYGEVFSQGIDIIIERNAFDPKHSSFIINTSSNKLKQRNFNLENFPIVFKHATGFITVVDMPIEEFAEKISSILSEVV